jgi:hypothetical protein
MEHKLTGEQIADMILKQMTEFNLFVVKNYANLPLLPENIEFNISRIQMLNFNKEKNTIGQILNYGMFTSVAPDVFPIATNTLIDYSADECVSPIMIVDCDENRYRISHIYWHSIVSILSTSSDDIFPKKIFIDEKYTWINNLIN